MKFELLDCKLSFAPVLEKLYFRLVSYSLYFQLCVEGSSVSSIFKTSSTKKRWRNVVPFDHPVVATTTHSRACYYNLKKMAQKLFEKITTLQRRSASSSIYYSPPRVFLKKQNLTPIHMNLDDLDDSFKQWKNDEINYTLQKLSLYY